MMDLTRVGTVQEVNEIQMIDAGKCVHEMRHSKMIQSIGIWNPEKK